jgi:hypothetical protein
MSLGFVYVKGGGEIFDRYKEQSKVGRLLPIDNPSGPKVFPVSPE